MANPLDPTRVLSLDEVAYVLDHIRLKTWPLREKRRTDRRARLLGRGGNRGNWRRKINLTIFRLSCCCGLRRQEMGFIKMKDVLLDGPRPCLRIRKSIGKGKKRPRVVPLWWDKGTLEDLRKWYEFRKKIKDAGEVVICPECKGSGLGIDEINLRSKCLVCKGEGKARTAGGPCGPESYFLCGLDLRNIGGKVTGARAAERWRSAIACLGPERVKQVSIHAGRHTFASLSLQAGHSLAEVRDALGHCSIAITSVYLHSFIRDDLPDVFAKPVEVG